MKSAEPLNPTQLNPSDIQSNPRAIQAKPGSRLSLLVALIRLGCLLLTYHTVTVALQLAFYPQSAL